MVEDFLLKIKGGYNQFTKAEKKVAGYILSSLKEVLFMPTTELAEVCGVGDTSVFCLCKTMDCKGYQEFKMLLSLSPHEGKQGFGQTESDISLENPFPQVAERVLSSNIRALKETHSLLKKDVLRRVTECFHEAGCICFYGMGTSMTTAMKVVDKFLKIEPKVHHASDSYMQAMMASTMSNGEVAVIFSYPRATKDAIHAAQLARQAGAIIVCVTRFIKSLLTAYADLALLCEANESSLQAGFSSTGISQLFLIDMLYTEYYRTCYNRCSMNSEKASASVMERLC